MNNNTEQQQQQQEQQAHSKPIELLTEEEAEQALNRLYINIANLELHKRQQMNIIDAVVDHIKQLNQKKQMAKCTTLKLPKVTKLNAKPVNQQQEQQVASETNSTT